MISKIRTKLRNLINDVSKNDTESFTMGSGSTLTLATENVSAITQITVNGDTLDDSDYSYDSDSQTITFESGVASSGDVVIVYFTYNKYSDTELLSFIKNAVDHLAINQYYPNFEISSGEDEIYPVPSSEEIKLIAVVTSILIKPDWSSYSIASVRIQYPRTKDKDAKIREVINFFKRSNGICGTVEL